MKIVTRGEFQSLPKGSLFQVFSDGTLDGLYLLDGFNPAGLPVVIDICDQLDATEIGLLCDGFDAPAAPSFVGVAVEYGCFAKFLAWEAADIESLIGLLAMSYQSSHGRA